MLIKQEDTLRHKGLRKRLIDEIQDKGIRDQAVLHAMSSVPRHFFLDPAFDKIAYEDRAFKIEAEQTISQPYTVAYQSSLLDVKPLQKILEIGTGSAYQASILAAMGAMVYTIERKRELYMMRSLKYPLMDKYGRKIKFFHGDGFDGLPGYAPFDRILITAAAPDIPPKLLAQLKPGGIMVLPLDTGTEASQRMTKIIKTAEGKTIQEHYDQFSFVPMLGGKD